MKKLRKWLLRFLNAVEPYPYSPQYIIKVPTETIPLKVARIIDYSMGIDRDALDNYTNCELAQQLASYIRKNNLWKIEEERLPDGNIQRSATLYVVKEKY